MMTIPPFTRIAMNGSARSHGAHGVRRSSAMPELRLRSAASHGEAGAVRSALRDWLGPLDELLRDDTILVASELFSNAVDAATPSTDIEVCLSSDSSSVVVEVTNVGAGFDEEEVRIPSSDRPGGRGIAIAKALGSVNVEQAQGSTTVRVVLPRRPGP
jgi:anti-sigma regulatory factor (Ser/Thr protein kinase)